MRPLTVLAVEIAALPRVPAKAVFALICWPVAVWPLQRYETRIAQADVIDLTFLHGRDETILTVPVFELVP